MAYLSGTTGYITFGSCTVAAITDWNATIGAPTDEFFTVDGGGWGSTVARAFRGSGTINAVLDDAALISSIAQSGDTVTVALISNTSGPSYTGTIRLGQFETTVNLEGVVQRLSIPFTTDGAMAGTLFT